MTTLSTANVNATNLAYCESTQKPGETQKPVGTRNEATTRIPRGDVNPVLISLISLYLLDLGILDQSQSSRSLANYVFLNNI
jgi:hypothetical protein